MLTKLNILFFLIGNNKCDTIKQTLKGKIIQIFVLIMYEHKSTTSYFNSRYVIKLISDQILSGVNFFIPLYNCSVVLSYKLLKR